MSQKVVAREILKYTMKQRGLQVTMGHTASGHALSLSETSLNIVCTPASAAASTWDFQF